MDTDNLIFSSNIDPQVEEVCFDILYNRLFNVECNKVYVKNVVLSPNEIIFFVEIDDKESILRVQVEND